MYNRTKLCIWFNLSDPDQKRAYDLIRDRSKKNGNSLAKCVTDLITEPKKEISLSDSEAEKIARLISKRLIESRLFPASSAILNEEYGDIKPDDGKDKNNQFRNDRERRNKTVVSSSAKVNTMSEKSEKAVVSGREEELGEPNKDTMNAIYKMMGMNV